MQTFTDDRQSSTADEIWFVEHPAVFTLGLNASREHLLSPGDIPVVQIDRGGQVTYHGPGQLVVYPLIDLRRRGLGVRELVMALRTPSLATLRELGATAQGSREAPGGMCRARWRASVCDRRGASYHGVALNVSLDLAPFDRINVCGHRGLAVTRLVDHAAGLAGHGATGALDTVAQALTPHLLWHLKYRSDTGAPVYSAINTDLQAVNSR
jgi:lipoyl(octanoyl) transferase